MILANTRSNRLPIGLRLRLDGYSNCVSEENWREVLLRTPQNQGRKPAFRGKQLEELNEFVRRHPDATLEEIREHFSGNVNCSLVAIHHTLKRLGWRYKKKRYEPVSKTEKM
jgi:transposase